MTRYKSSLWKVLERDPFHWNHVSNHLTHPIQIWAAFPLSLFLHKTSKRSDNRTFRKASACTISFSILYFLLSLASTGVFVTYFQRRISGILKIHNRQSSREKKSKNIHLKQKILAIEKGKAFDFIYTVCWKRFEMTQAMDSFLLR